MNSLWPSFDADEIQLPKTILDEQARIFNNNMQGLLECKITTREQPSDMWKPLSMNRDEETVEKAQQLLMHIIAPQAGGYRLAILVVTFLVTSVYPCTIDDCLEENTFQVADENEFKLTLKNILNSKKLINAVNVLKSQSR